MAKTPIIDLNFFSRTLVKRLALTCAALLLVHIVLTIIHYQFMDLPWLLRELFDVDEEDSVPTWYSSALLLLAGVVLFLIAALSRRKKDKNSVYWTGLALGFVFMSADEIAGFHETLNTILEISWAIPGLLVALLIGGLYLKFLSSLPPHIAMKFMMSGAIFVGGAVGVELATEPYLYNDALNTLAYNLWTPVEEGMEMGSVILFLSGLFEYIELQFGTQFKVRFK